MFEAGREFYKNEVSIERLVRAMQLVEQSNDQEEAKFRVNLAKRTGSHQMLKTTEKSEQSQSLVKSEEIEAD